MSSMTVLRFWWRERDFSTAFCISTFCHLDQRGEILFLKPEISRLRSK